MLAKITLIAIVMAVWLLWPVVKAVDRIAMPALNTLYQEGGE